jgi:hypothetical protein
MQPSISIGLTSKCVYASETHLAYAQDEPVLHVMPDQLTDILLQDHFTARVLQHKSCRSGSHSAVVAYPYYPVPGMGKSFVSQV